MIIISIIIIIIIILIIIAIGMNVIIVMRIIIIVVIIVVIISSMIMILSMIMGMSMIGTTTGQPRDNPVELARECDAIGKAHMRVGVSRCVRIQAARSTSATAMVGLVSS